RGCNPTSSKFIHTWLRFGEIMRGSLRIARLRDVHGQKLSKEAQKLAKLPFRRAITKKEQADMGKLKKSVRGLIVVHPMTELGREMGLKEMTGFAKSEF
ncbi:YibL family ribosome-associated protein, partial [Citrobacter braakii]|uniref:YibL family ribosome-associated protein n=1 Tax=Citrobacter braakii TaxID=57706 RepID=UPI0006526243